jgi:hypothetical protein
MIADGGDEDDDDLDRLLSSSARATTDGGRARLERSPTRATLGQSPLWRCSRVVDRFSN